MQAANHPCYTSEPLCLTNEQKKDCCCVSNKPMIQCDLFSKLILHHSEFVVTLSFLFCYTFAVYLRVLNFKLFF